MVGEKRRIEEGGTRNFLAVKGPGVKRGLVQPQLTHVTDLFPTLLELAGTSGTAAGPSGPLDGMSIANMVFGGAPTEQQRDRVVVELDVTCAADDFVPLLDPKTRRTLKPQPLLDYYKGGDEGTGFKRCVGARWRDYKWLGKSDQLYLFKGGSHEEAPCAAVSDEPVRQRLSSAAKSWFDSVVASPNAFERPRFFVGAPGRASTAVLGNGAAERTAGRVSVLPTGLVGFAQPGDAANWRVQVQAAGNYNVAVGLRANHKARFRLTLGTPEQLKNAAAAASSGGGGKNGSSSSKNAPAALPLRYEFDADPSISVYRPDRAFQLPLSDPSGPPAELRLEMVSTSKKGAPAVRALSDVTFARAAGGGGGGGSNGSGGAAGGGGALAGYKPYDVDNDEGVGAWRDENRDKLARLAGNVSGKKSV